MQRGVYPDSWHKGSLGAEKGKIQDDAPNEKKAHPGNSYSYKACPESVDEVEKQIQEDEKNVPQYSLYNSGARNCCGWACEIVEEAGFTAPFVPNTPTLAPAPEGTEAMAKEEILANKQKRTNKLFKMKKMWIALGIITLYLAYLPLSLIWSALDTGQGYEKSVSLLSAVKKDLDLNKIFAQHGMKLVSDGASWRGKTCELCFVVENETNARIPPEVEEYILNNPDLVKGCRVQVQIMLPPESKEKPYRIYCKKNLFSMETFLLKIRDFQILYHLRILVRGSCSKEKRSRENALAQKIHGA